MSKLKKVEWTWNHGKVFSKLIYENDEFDLRKNDKPPPTNSSHDIAHFICGFNENLEWDYQIEPNHIVEYNAVFVEQLLVAFSHYYYHNNHHSIDIGVVSEQIDNYMKWFSEIYYKIQEDHPSKKYHADLKKDFFNKLDIKTLEKYFLQFYHTWVVEKLMGNQKFNIIITMDSTVDYEFKPLYDYLIQVKKILTK